MSDIKTTCSCSVNGHEYVDLGLQSGTLWATCNVGAIQPADYGDYFAWGETLPKDSYSWNTYKWTNDGGESFTKYTFAGDVTLSSSDDAATQNWGRRWRMPTFEEILELMSGCNWTWVNNFEGSGVSGRIGTSKKNGNKIFLPASGYRCGTGLYYDDGNGYYWSSSLYACDSRYVCSLYFDSVSIARSDRYRSSGRSVRAVVCEII